MTNIDKGMQRPATVQQALTFLSEYLSLSDRLVNALAAARNKPDRIASDEVQRDLVAMAEWFDSNPDVAREIWAFVSAKH